MVLSVTLHSGICHWGPCERGILKHAINFDYTPSSRNGRCELIQHNFHICGWHSGSPLRLWQLIGYHFEIVHCLRIHSAVVLIPWPCLLNEDAHHSQWVALPIGKSCSEVVIIWTVVDQMKLSIITEKDRNAGAPQKYVPLLSYPKGLPIAIHSVLRSLAILATPMQMQAV